MKKILLSILLIFALSANSQNIFRDDLSTYTTGQQLNGQGTWTNNSSNAGGLGGCTGAICSNAQVITQNITASGYGSSTKSFSLTPDTDGCGKSFTAVTSGDIYVGLVINISNSSASPTDFFRVSSGSNYNTSFRMLVKATSGTTYSIGISKGGTTNPITYTSNSYNYGADYLVIFKYTQSSGASDDTLTLFANPNYAAGESGNIASATTFAGTDQSGSIDRLTFRQNATNGLPTGYLGLVSVAKTWADLTFLLSTNQFSKNSFKIISNQISNGVLDIFSPSIIENATLKIFAMNGSVIENKIISLVENNNQFSISPLRNSGVYIVEISTSTNGSFIQTILIN